MGVAGKQPKGTTRQEHLDRAIEISEQLDATYNLEQARKEVTKKERL